MTTAVTMMAASTAVSAAGAGISMYGQYQQGKAQQEAAEYDAQMKEIQAESLNEKLRDDVRRKNDATRQTIERGKAKAAGSGINIASDNVLDWEGDVFETSAKDEAAMRHNTRLNEWGLKSGAELDRARGKNARRSANIGMITTAFGTGASVAGDWASFGMAGQ